MTLGMLNMINICNFSKVILNLKVNLTFVLQLQRAITFAIV